MSSPSDEAKAEVPPRNRTGETFTGPSFRFGGPAALVTFNTCVSKEVDLTFDGNGEGVFIFENCEWTNSHLNFLGEDDFYSFENCTFTNTVLVGGPDLTEAQNDAEGNGTAILQGQLSSFVIRGCTFVGSQTVDIEPGKTFPRNAQDFSFRDTSQESDAITFSKCVFALTGNPSGDAGMGQGQGAGSSASVDDKGTPDSADAPAN